MRKTERACFKSDPPTLRNVWNCAGQKRSDPNRGRQLQSWAIRFRRHKRLNISPHFVLIQRFRIKDTNRRLSGGVWFQEHESTHERKKSPRKRAEVHRSFSIFIMEEKKEESEAEIHEHGPEHWFSKWERQCLAEAEREEPREEVDQNQEKLWHLFQNSATAVAQLYKGLCTEKETPSAALRLPAARLKKPFALEKISREPLTLVSRTNHTFRLKSPYLSHLVTKVIKAAFYVCFSPCEWELALAEPVWLCLTVCSLLWWPC